MDDEVNAPKKRHSNCDGCNAGMETRTSRLTGSEIHYDKWGRPFMGCTADRYEEKEQ